MSENIQDWRYRFFSPTLHPPPQFCSWSLPLTQSRLSWINGLPVSRCYIYWSRRWVELVDSCNLSYGFPSKSYETFISDRSRRWELLHRPRCTGDLKLVHLQTCTKRLEAVIYTVQPEKVEQIIQVLLLSHTLTNSQTVMHHIHLNPHFSPSAQESKDELLASTGLQCIVTGASEHLIPPYF